LAKIGINGGSFDPIHFGHLRPALEVTEALGLDEMRFVPAFQTVHRDQPQASADQRCEMVQLAIASQPLFRLELCEIERQGPSFMVDTLQTLAQREPENERVLMMGMDAFSHFHRWHKWQEILQLANLAVTFRPGAALPSQGKVAALLVERQVSQLSQPAGQIQLVPVTQLDISSTKIRQLIQAGGALDYLMPPSVIDYVKQHTLYGRIE